MPPKIIKYQGLLKRNLSEILKKVQSGVSYFDITWSYIISVLFPKYLSLNYSVICTGLHFSPEHKKCMLPELADCQIERVCPLEDGDHPIFFPDPEDCTKYFLCFNGSPILRTCADGLYWDVVDEWCTFPETVQCHPGTSNDPSSDPSVTVTTEQITDETTELTTDLTTETSTEASTEPPSTIPTTTKDPNYFDCPINNVVTMHPHPTICKNYFICFQGRSHLMTCADGLIFDTIQSQCFPEDQATCILELETFRYNIS